MNDPRIGLLTWCSPESRYAGGAAVRRLLEQFPQNSIRWCGFHAGVASEGVPAYRAFPPRAIHWRLRGTWIEHAVVDGLQARRLATHMWDWLKPFDPQMLWVFPEVWAVMVGLELQRISGLPLHATVHDAPESAAFGGVPVSYMPAYLRHFARFLRQARSVDAVSDPLIAHLRACGSLAPACATLVVPPSVPTEALAPVADPAARDGAERRIGVCGSFRQSTEQWAAFLRTLGALPYRIVIACHTPPAEIPNAPVPANVTVAPQPYADSEATLIRALMGMDATYLGLWTEPARQLFGDTSVSSKLTTYAAAARPIIVDARETSVAWRLVEQHGAGIRLGNQPETERVRALAKALERDSRWRAMALGARQLCVSAFDLTRNVACLKSALQTTAQIRIPQLATSGTP